MNSIRMGTIRPSGAASPSFETSEASIERERPLQRCYRFSQTALSEGSEKSRRAVLPAPIPSELLPPVCQLGRESVQERVFGHRPILRVGNELVGRCSQWPRLLGD